ncbi:hypothetical protein JTE90_025470 [Oedothorax gibbosus]|uniref:Uncharacterized protein n=1 Tax=Oedothorax gibbosus TaxID=931172 RepID=A0AAV6UY12_9ARAC|nr:hypothetical protein JTE90_025470 [Oedothorax gibbosus]
MVSGFWMIAINFKISFSSGKFLCTILLDACNSLKVFLFKAAIMNCQAITLTSILLLAMLEIVSAQINSTDDNFNFTWIREGVTNVAGRVYQKSDRYDFAAQVLRALFEHLFAVFYYT